MSIEHVFPVIIVTPVIHQFLQRCLGFSIPQNEIKHGATQSAQIKTWVRVNARLLFVKVRLAIILCRGIAGWSKTVAAKKFVVEFVDVND